MTLDEWRLVGKDGNGKAYLPNASSKTAKAVNAGVDARYKSLVEAAMGEGKPVICLYTLSTFGALDGINFLFDRFMDLIGILHISR